MLRVALLLLVVGSCAAACSDDSTATATSSPDASTTTTAVMREPTGHEVWQERLVDTSRPTTPSTGPSAPTRTLETTIYQPQPSGPHPLIVFAHGISGHPDKHTELFSAWADAGFVVAAPAFPLTNAEIPNAFDNVGDVGQQTEDLAFVIRQVVALGQDPDSRLFEAIDAANIGVSGLSAGSIAAYSVAFGGTYRGLGVTAAAILDGYATEGLDLDGHIRLLIAHSDTDPAIEYANATNAFAAAAAPVWLFTLHGASHASQWEDDVTPYDDIAETVTTDYWRATLLHDAAAADLLIEVGTVASLASIESK
jgi:dienelactone hydrolase